MNTDKNGLIESELCERVIGVFYDVYKELGSGFLESVYENTMAITLRKSDFAYANKRRRWSDSAAM